MPAVPYRELFISEPLPERFRRFEKTPFRIAMREPESASSGEILLIFPGFGVSVAQIQVDRLLWNRSARYRCIVTHDAVNYCTSHDFLLWQYAALLRRLPPFSTRMLGMSLGGTTAVQLLFALREEPLLCARVKKLVTLVAAVSESDFTPRWQNILQLIRELKGGERPQGELQRLLRRTVLRAVAQAIKKNVQRSCLEASSCDEIIAGFTHFSEAYGLRTRALPLGMALIRERLLRFRGQKAGSGTQLHLHRAPRHAG